VLCQKRRIYVYKRTCPPTVLSFFLSFFFTQRFAFSSKYKFLLSLSCPALSKLSLAWPLFRDSVTSNHSPRPPRPPESYGKFPGPALRSQPLHYIASNPFSTKLATCLSLPPYPLSLLLSCRSSLITCEPSTPSPPPLQIP
jgi:hypothetical protein